MNKEQALLKIEKCMRLGKSSNEHEAANAIKQAQALMRQFSLTEDDVMVAGIKEYAVDTLKSKLPQWQWDLVHCIKEHSV